ncbi:periplasmic heavy metal sensor [Desulfobacterales bacterium HSG16]|nr:periplasmic heavy metal sensor [Desulfobacterales bacterium HSG16]
MKKIVCIAVVFMLAFTGMGMAKGKGRAKGEMGMSGGVKGGMGIPGGKWWRMPRLAEKIALTDDEKKKLDAMNIEKRRKMIDLTSQVAKEKLELEVLLDADKFNPEACMNRFKNVQDASAATAMERFKFLVEVRQLLGVDRFRELKNTAKGFRRQHMNKKRMNKKKFKDGRMQGNPMQGGQIQGGQPVE